MKYALVGAGAVGRTALGRLPKLSQQLGPVAAASHRLASRIVNSLRAGQPLKDLAGLDSTALILICAPGGTIVNVIDALRQAEIAWQRKVLVLFDSEMFSTELAEF